MNEVNITMELAERILANRVVVGDVGVCETSITVGSVSEGIKDANGTVTPFYWEDEDGNPDTTRPYVIVNLNAMSEAQMQRAEELFEEGEYQGAVNSRTSYDDPNEPGTGAGNFSLRMSPEEVQKNRIAKGSIVSGTFDYRLNSQDEEILVCVAVAPLKAKAKTNGFRDRIKARKQQPEVQAQQENA